jgi:hypothetical protein
MATARGFQVRGVADGGPSAKGENVWFQLDLFDGTQAFKAGFFVPRDMFAVLIQKLLHFGGLTREEYLKSRPAAEADGAVEAIYAPPIVNVLGGDSAGRNAAILNLQTGEPARPMNLYLAADASVLRQLITTAQLRLAELERGQGPANPVH